MRAGRGWWARVPRFVVTIVSASLVVAAGLGWAGWWYFHRGDNALPQASCGRAITHYLSGDTRILGADRGALTCFGSAARECKPASIAVTEMGVDTGTDYVFTTEPGGTPCQVQELSQGYSANFGGSVRPIGATSCRRTAVAARGVLLSCAGQAVLIPATVSAR